MKFDLVAVQHIINLNTPVKADIKYVYADFDANFMHFNVISTFPEEYQILTNEEAELAYKGKLDIDMVKKIIDRINSRGW